MPECYADHGCAPPIADTRALRPLGKSDAPPRSRSRRRRPSGDPELLESPGLPSQSSLLHEALAPLPARLASARELPLLKKWPPLPYSANHTLISGALSEGWLAEPRTCAHT